MDNILTVDVKCGMAVSAHAVANTFISLAADDGGKRLTNMQLQKLVFIAHGYCLAIKGTPLYFHNTHAWQWGPVIPKLYKSLQKYGSQEVEGPIPADDVVDPKSEEFQIINGVWEGYGHLSGARLSAITHQDHTPWSQTWEKDRFGVIDNDIIASHYRQLIEES